MGGKKLLAILSAKDLVITAEGKEEATNRFTRWKMDGEERSED